MRPGTIRLVLSAVLIAFLTMDASTLILAKPASIYQEKYQLRLIEIASELDTFVQTQGAKNKHVNETVRLVRQKRAAGDLLFKVNFDDTGMILGGAAFANYPADKKGQPALILVTVPLIDLYPKHRSLVWGLLINAYKLAHDYFTNTDAFLNQENNDLEAYRYRMDAALVEASFLKEYVKPEGSFSSTKFEDTLVSSLEADNLRLYSLLFEAVEMRVAYRLSDIFYQYQASRDRPAARRALIDLANIVLDLPKKVDTADEWQNYCAQVMLLTFQKYGALVFGFIESDGEGIIWGEALARDHTFALLYKRIEEQAVSKKEFALDYHEKAINEFKAGLRTE